MAKRYEQLKTLIEFAKPQTIIEIGTHNGASAELMCREALKYQDKVHYTGYDLFDEADEHTNKAEKNGKGPGDIEAVREMLSKIEGLTFELVKGNTRQTLHGQKKTADFVFIDGGHSIETIAGDYEAVRTSRVIALDDYYSDGIDTKAFGCNELLSGIPHEVLPDKDRVRGGGKVQIAAIGYSSKWAKALEKIRKDDGMKSVSLWRGEDVQPADLIACCNTLEPAIDVDKALEDIRKLVRKRLFFVIKADFRPLEWWREKLAKYFQVLQWFAPGKDEVCGTAMPLMVVGEWESRGVLDDDKRHEQAVANCNVIGKRVAFGDGNDKRAVIVCYGPSLLQTWSQIHGEKQFMDADIVSVSGAHDFLVRRGIRPDYHVECDPRAHKALNLNSPQEGTQYYIASCCHPDLVGKLKDYDTSLWHLCNGQDSFRILEELESERDQVLVTGGGSAGLRAISVFYAIGYRQFSIYGMDCSFSKEEEPRQWAGPHKGKKQKVIDIKCGDVWFKTSPVLVTYARHFFDTVQRAPGAKFTVYGDGLLQEMCKRSVQQEAA